MIWPIFKFVRTINPDALDKRPGYTKFYTREALYYVGNSLMKKGEYDDALKYLYKADEASRALDQDASGFIVLTNLKIGQIMDIQGKRDLAIKQYNKVLAWPDKQNSKQLAQQFIDKPYGK